MAGEASKKISWRASILPLRRTFKHKCEIGYVSCEQRHKPITAIYRSIRSIHAQHRSAAGPQDASQSGARQKNDPNHNTKLLVQVAKTESREKHKRRHSRLAPHSNQNGDVCTCVRALETSRTQSLALSPALHSCSVTQPPPGALPGVLYGECGLKQPGQPSPGNPPAIRQVPATNTGSLGKSSREKQASRQKAHTLTATTSDATPLHSLCSMEGPVGQWWGRRDGNGVVFFNTARRKKKGRRTKNACGRGRTFRVSICWIDYSITEYSIFIFLCICFMRSRKNRPGFSIFCSIISEN